MAGAVTAAQLSGTGVWAVRHGKPLIGMAGYPEANLGEVGAPAVALTAVTAVGALAAGVVVITARAYRPRSPER
ncbi:hypothetical protein [Catellatospora vulcania]|uniref:hypothetical protein n=1 Tax=Catellatospora vulcania TaxID=1460450 RepID=UPI0012D3B1BB|nr:hypothetical protein [Catellatospora vulcania]